MSPADGNDGLVMEGVREAAAPAQAAMIEYTAEYDPVGLAAAERAFYVRSIRELRFARTFVAPGVFLAAAVGASALGGPEWAVALSFAALGLSVGMPLIFFFLRPMAAAAQARKHPSAVIGFDEEGLTFRFAQREVPVPWTRFERLWDGGGYHTLVQNAFVAVHLPKRGLPEEAAALMRRSIVKEPT